RPSRRLDTGMPFRRSRSQAPAFPSPDPPCRLGVPRLRAIHSPANAIRRADDRASLKLLALGFLAFWERSAAVPSRRFTWWRSRPSAGLGLLFLVPSRQDRRS